jgi:hypothetical protein
LRSYWPSARKEIGERRELAIVYQRIPLIETVACSKDRRLERPATRLLWAWLNYFSVQASRRVISRVISRLTARKTFCREASLASYEERWTCRTYNSTRNNAKREHSHCVASPLQMQWEDELFVLAALEGYQRLCHR